MATRGSNYLSHPMIEVASGIVNGVSHIHKFGAVPEMTKNQSGTIWDINDTNYPWSVFDSDGASTLTVDRANAGDAGKTIFIQGLDADYLEISDTVTLTNATGNATTKSFIRVFRAFMIDTSATNVGLISIKKGATTVGAINADKGQTLMGVYTIPAGKTGFLMKGICSCQSGGDLTADMFVRYGGQTSFRVGHTFEVTGTGGPYVYEFPVPIAIPERSDIDIRASARTNNIRITVAFDMVLKG